MVSSLAMNRMASMLEMLEPMGRPSLWRKNWSLKEKYMLFSVTWRRSETVSSVRKHIYSIPTRTKTIKALMSRLLWAKTTPLIYASLKHFTLESASLHSIPEKNVLNSQTFYFSILFESPFLSTFRGPLSRDTPSLELCILLTIYFYSLHTYVTSFTYFTLTLSLQIYSARGRFSHPWWCHWSAKAWILVFTF